MGDSSDALPRTPICPNCGVVAPVHGTQCQVCHMDLTQPRSFAPPFADVYWAAVRCTFPCRACGFPSPLDGLVASEALDCAQCGSLQRFEPNGWSDAIPFAHALGDLGGPYPEGRMPNPAVWIGDHNPHAGVGVDRLFETRDSAKVSIEACPGFPVCGRCHRPLVCQVGQGDVSTRCEGCGATARYVLPAPLSAMAPALRGAVAEEHRVQRRDVTVQGSAAGVSALLCPQCGAALHGIGGPIAECAYCKTVAYVPLRARPRETGKLVAPSVFWLAFSLPSAERGRIERQPIAPTIAASVKKAAGFFSRGLSAIVGVELAERAPGPDLRQWSLTLSLTALALGVGYALVTLVFGSPS